MEHKVKLSQMKFSNDPDDLIITYSLGSCIGISLYDAEEQVGGLLHFQLPDSKSYSSNNHDNPYVFADMAIPAFFDEAFKRGAKKDQIKTVIAGGSDMMGSKGNFDIGKRNVLATKKILFNNNIDIKYIDVGGNFLRTMKLFIRTGSTHIITPTRKTEVD